MSYAASRAAARQVQAELASLQRERDRLRQGLFDASSSLGTIMLALERATDPGDDVALTMAVAAELHAVARLGRDAAIDTALSHPPTPQEER